MGVTDNRNDPGLNVYGSDGQQQKYLVLSDEERAKGFVRPLRTSYKHVGCPPPTNLRDLTEEEHERYDRFGYIKFEAYPESESPVTGRFWTLDQLNSGCGHVTTMGLAIAETYARDPRFYGGTFCATCKTHLPVGADGEFTWIDPVTGQDTNERVGT